MLNAVRCSFSSSRLVGQQLAQNAQQDFELRPNRRLHQLAHRPRVGLAISRMMSRVCQVSSGPVRTRRMNVVMKSASFCFGGVSADHSGSWHSLHPPAMRPHDRFDVQPLLVAEVVIHGGDIRAGRWQMSRTVVASKPRSAKISPAASTDPLARCI